VSQDLKAELNQHLSTSTNLVGARVSCKAQPRPHASTLSPLPLPHGASFPTLAPPMDGALNARNALDTPSWNVPLVSHSQYPAHTPMGAPSLSAMSLPDLASQASVQAAIDLKVSGMPRLALPSEAAAAVTARTAASSPRTQRPRTAGRAVL